MAGRRSPTRRTGRYWAVELFVGLGVVASAAFAPHRMIDAVAAIGVGGLTALVVFAAARLA